MRVNYVVRGFAAARRGLAGAVLLVCGLPLAPGACLCAELAAGGTTPPETSSRILFTEFRGPPAKEGWEALGSSSEPAKAAPIAVAEDPGEHGVRIEKGTLAGPKCAVLPYHYYRVRFRAKTERKAYWSAQFLTVAGRELGASVWDSVGPSSDWQTHVFCVRAHPDTAHMRIQLQPIDSPLSVRNLVVETVGPQEVLAWADGVASQCPLVQFEPAVDRWRHLPRTMERLRQGGKLRVVMLGDSICNDTSNSLYETQLSRLYPKARIEIVTSVRGGTGCWYYKDENHVKEHVLDYKPELLMIAGISHRFEPEPIRSVIRQVRQSSDCEILVMSGAVTPNDFLQRMHLIGKPVSQAMDEMENFTGRLRRMCREEQVEFFDLRRAWDDHLSRSQTPYDLISRDIIHANSRGKQLLARMLVRYFAAQDDSLR